MAEGTPPIKVLVAEDSRTARAWLVGLLRAAGMAVVEVANGLDAVHAARLEAPSVVVMDLQLPGLDGIEAIRRIMAESPCPIVVLTGQLHREDVDVAFEALNAGALEVVAKPSTADPAERAEIGRRFVRTLRVMERVKVVRRRRSQPRTSPAALTLPAGTSDLAMCRVLGIGASTGGPPVVRLLLDRIAAPARVPILISQHIGPGFEEGFARWLSDSGHPVDVLTGPADLEPGRVYVSPASSSLVLTAPERLGLKPGGPQTRLLPSIDATFDSLATHQGRRAAGVLLTGMGRDGARGLGSIRDAGGATFAQSEATCAVFGMPRVAHEVGAVDVLHSPDDLARDLGAGFGAPRGLA